MKNGKLPALKLREQCINGFKVYTLYRNFFPYNCLYKDNNGTIWGDCVCLIKSLIWAWSCGVDPFLNRKNNSYFYNGINGSYNGIKESGLPDYDIDQLMIRCTPVSFSNLKVGALLAYYGQHIALYIGDFFLNGKYYNGVEYNMYSDSFQGLIPFWVDSKGIKYYHQDGAILGSFTRAGLLKDYIEYDAESKNDQPIVKTVTYRSELYTGAWLPEVISGPKPSDTAGIPSSPMYGLMVKSLTLKGYCVRCSGQSNFLPIVTGYNIDDSENGFAGDLMPITDVAINDPGIAYRVKIMKTQEWLPVVYGKDFNLKNGETGYAGDLEIIDEIEIWRID